jgi:hypothetical protein
MSFLVVPTGVSSTDGSSAEKESFEKHSFTEVADSVDSRDYPLGRMPLSWRDLAPGGEDPDVCDLARGRGVDASLHPERVVPVIC